MAAGKTAKRCRPRYLDRQTVDERYESKGLAAPGQNAECYGHGDRFHSHELVESLEAAPQGAKRSGGFALPCTGGDRLKSHSDPAKSRANRDGSQDHPDKYCCPTDPRNGERHCRSQAEQYEEIEHVLQNEARDDPIVRYAHRREIANPHQLTELSGEIVRAKPET